ncbi:MAG: cation-transporting P-type ATPase, partial [Pseudobdellovibrionaceae bacterium]
MKKKVSFENLTGLKKRSTGLNDVEVSQQRLRFGLNEIVERVGNPWLDLLKETLKDPMIWFLFGIGTVFILVGDKQEAIILFLAILPLLIMDAFLHWRTQASTAALKGQQTTEATVIRNAQQITINSHDVVPGDLIVLSPK